MHATICDFISDIVQNAIEAGSTLVILDIRQEKQRLEIFVSDNGKGMDMATLDRATDPFFTGDGKHARRRVGLGLPFLKQAVEATGGEFDVKSEKDLGTSVYFRFDPGHVDTPPMGDLVATLLSCLSFGGNFELTVNRTLDGRDYSVSRQALAGSLGDLCEAESLLLAKRYLCDLENSLTNEEN